MNDPREKEREREEEEEARIKVTDRRKFTLEGELRTDFPEEPTSSPQTEERPREEQAGPSASKGRRRDAGPQSEPRPEGQEKMDFASFLLSLATSAMVQLGEIADPATGQTMRNLAGARQMIEILDLLQEKTRGNLTAEEGRLLEDLLYELRMKFVNQSKSIKTR